MTTRHQLTIAAIVMALAGLALVGTLDAQDAEQQDALYCDMVQLHHESSGEHGWPPYKGECQ